MRNQVARFGGRRSASILLVGVLVLACGDNGDGGDDDDEAATETADAATESAERLEEIYAEIDGLEGQERQDALLELAEEEEGDLSVYGSMNAAEQSDIYGDFEDETGIAVSMYRGSSPAVLQRVMEEAAADYAGSDVVFTSGPEMQLFDDEGLFLPYSNPAATDELVQAAVYENWAGVYLNVIGPAWNEDRLDGDDIPTTWEEVLSFDGVTGVYVGSWDLFATIVNDYFVAQQGMSEEDAIELFAEGFSGSTVMSQRIPQHILLTQGEFDLIPDSQVHEVEEVRIEEGGPIAWQPPVEPFVSRPNGAGVHVNAQHPAKALLLIDYLISAEVQETLRDNYRTPSNTSIEGGIPPDLEVLGMDLDLLLEDREHWESIWQDEVLRGLEVRD